MAYISINLSAFDIANDALRSLDFIINHKRVNKYRNYNKVCNVICVNYPILDELLLLKEI